MFCFFLDCGGKIGGLSGTFFSPNFPNKYPDNSRCSWTIRGPPGTKKIIIKFLEFYLEVDTKCRYKSTFYIDESHGYVLGNSSAVKIYIIRHNHDFHLLTTSVNAKYYY